MNGVERSNDGVVLRKCPFCGGEARLQRGRKKSDYYVVCKKCGCRTPLFQYQFDSKEERRKDAIKAWNTRKPVEEAQKRLEEVKVSIFDDYIEEYEDMVYLEDAIEIIKEELM